MQDKKDRYHLNRKRSQKYPERIGEQQNCVHHCCQVVHDNIQFGWVGKMIHLKAIFPLIWTSIVIVKIHLSYISQLILKSRQIEKYHPALFSFLLAWPPQTWQTFDCSPCGYEYWNGKVKRAKKWKWKSPSYLASTNFAKSFGCSPCGKWKWHVKVKSECRKWKRSIDQT